MSFCRMKRLRLLQLLSRRCWSSRRLGPVEVGPTYRHVKSLQGSSVKRMSMMFIKHHQCQTFKQCFFMVYVVGCYGNDCLDICSSLSLSEVVSCWKANEYSYLNFLSIFFLTFFSPREHSFSEFKWCCFHNLEQIMLFQASLVFQYQLNKRTRQQSLSKATMRRTGEVRDVPDVEVFVWSRCCWRKINKCAWFQVHVLLTALINSLYLSNNERRMSRCWACSRQGWIYACVICPCSRSYHV